MRGELAEWSNAAVLKTVEVNSLLGFESLTLRHKKEQVFSPVLFLRKVNVRDENESDKKASCRRFLIALKFALFFLIL